jgi:phosphoenolpyruvate synthase/pyruvate phosphate dikinase
VAPDGTRFNEGDWISVDGSTGNVYGEKVEVVDATISGNFEKFMNWADQYRVLKVRTNADTPKDAKQAYEFIKDLIDAEDKYDVASFIKFMNEKRYELAD